MGTVIWGGGGHLGLAGCCCEAGTSREGVSFWQKGKRNPEGFRFPRLPPQHLMKEKTLLGVPGGGPKGCGVARSLPGKGDRGRSPRLAQTFWGGGCANLEKKGDADRSNVFRTRRLGCKTFAGKRSRPIPVSQCQLPQEGMLQKAPGEGEPGALSMTKLLAE